MKRIELAFQSLQGVAIGDAFGDSFFAETNTVLEHIYQRTIPETQWEFTDDTVMSIAVFEQLEKYGKINQEELVQSFFYNHELDPNRGYGATVRRVLREIGEGGYWKEISQSVFEGMGSMGNGAAMRANSIGAYFYDDLEIVKKLAKESAEVTHTNIEAITGAMAVALATALSTQIQHNNLEITPTEFIEKIVQELPDTDTTSKINKALSIPSSYNIETIRTILGDGTKMLAQDTVPFSIWCAAHHLDNYEEALWKAVSILGDRDTICAIVGGIVMMSTKKDNIPQNWMNSV